jgi:hypothetical protein
MKVFLASSTEAFEELNEVANWLEELGHEPLPWDMPSLFLPGDNTFLRLIEISKQVDAAVFIFSEDDTVWYRADTVPQPRDNVLIEYGLFAGVLGQNRAIICRKGTPKSATDLYGIIVVDISEGKKQGARLKVRAWMQNLVRKGKEPAFADLILQNNVLRKELEETNERYIFEQQTRKDLQNLLTKHGLIDFSKYDFSADAADAHWKLLFNYDYFWDVASLCVKTFHTPTAWQSELKRCNMSNIIERISWDHMKDADRTRFYVAKALRIFRHPGDQDSYKNFLNHTAKPIRLRIDDIGRSRAASVQQESDYL